jgi:hypothetical protein
MPALLSDRVFRMRAISHAGAYPLKMGSYDAYDVLEDFEASVGGVLETSALEHFVFQGSDEGFGPGVFVGISPRGHALEEAGFV